MVLVAFFTWCITFLYHFFFEISSITEFFVVFIAIGLIINGIYFAGSIMILKRKFRKELRLDADRRIQENPDCEATRILYGKNIERSDNLSEEDKALYKQAMERIIKIKQLYYLNTKTRRKKKKGKQSQTDCLPFF